MSRLSLEAKIGALLLAGLLGIGTMIVVVEPSKLSREEGKTYLVLFDNVAGLEKDAPVRVAGVKVGKVKEVTVKDGKAVVEILITKPVKVYKDADAKIETMGLMGEKYVELMPGTSESGTLPEGSLIYARSKAVSLDEVMAGLKEVLDKFNSSIVSPTGENRIAKLIESVSETVENINGILQENRGTLKELMKNMLALTSLLKEELPEIMNNVNTLTEQLSQVVLENREDLRKTVISLREATQKAPQIAKQIEELTGKLNALLEKENIENIEETIANIKETTGELKEVLAKVNEGTGTIGKLFNDDRLYENLANATKVLGKYARKIDQTRTYIGFRGDVNTRTGDTRGVFSLKISPARTHYYLFEVVGDSQGRVEREKYYSTSSGWREEVETKYRTEFTLQYARVFPDPFTGLNGKFVLRGGIKESTGGVGLDYIFNDKLSLSADLWDGGRKESDGDEIPPHLRIGLRYHINKNWFVYGGGDELLYHKWRGFFIGTGVVFGDEDLKYLLGSVPGGLK